MLNPLIESLKQRLNVSIRYFTQVVHIGIEADPFRVPLILCLAEHSLLFLDSSFSKLLGEVFYAHLIKVVEQEDSSGEVIRFEYADNRPEGIPKKMTLITAEKLKILRFLRCCWETDHLWRLSKARCLKIYSEKIDLRRYRKEIKSHLANEIYLIPPNDSNRIELKNYGFFIKKFFRQTKLWAEYQGIDNKKVYFLKIDVKDIKLLETITKDLRSMAESVAERLAQDGEDFAYISSNPYMKKANLVMDLAKWEGWAIEIVTETIYISVIVLRRKFIPPVIDSGQDLIFSCTGGNNSRVICEQTADSCFSLGIANEVYKSVISQRCEALIMDCESSHFYQTRFEILPSKVFYAFQVILSILSIIDRQIADANIKKILEEIRKNPLAKKPDVIFGRLDDPNRILEEFCRSCFIEPGTLGYKTWRRKVLRYLAYCIDGGLLQQRLTLNDILLHLMNMKGHSNDTGKVAIFIARILDINEKSSDEEYEELHIGIGKMLESSGFIDENGNPQSKSYNPNKVWSFNTKVLISLIESGYLKRELEQNNLNSLFTKLLIYLLNRKSSSLELKSSICQITVNINESNDLLTLKVLLPHLLDIYNSNNYTLATQAAISLASLTYSNKENKQFIYTNRECVIKKMQSKDIKLLSYTILMLVNISSEQSRRKVISKDSRDALRKLIVGNKMVKQNTEVISKCFQILALFVKDHQNAEYFSGDQELVVAALRYLGESEECDVRLVGFYEVLCERNQAAKFLIGKKCIGPLLSHLNKVQNLEFIKRCLSLFKMLAINKSDENFQILQAAGTLKILEGLLQNAMITMDDSIVKQIKSLKEFLS